MTSIISSDRQRARGCRGSRGLLGAANFLLLLAGGGLVGSTAAQTPVPHSQPPLPDGQAAPWRLSVRREMATATRTERAGVYTTGLPRDYAVYVPPQCVGSRRCPLVVSIDGQNIVLDLHRPLADKYGMIVLVPQDTRGLNEWGPADVPRLDIALKQVFRTFAIDPEKIAVNGSSNGDQAAGGLWSDNPDLFSRYMSFAWHTCGTFYRRGAQASAPSRNYCAFRGHRRSSREANMMFGWLAEDWGLPGAPARVAPFPADSVPVLTADLLAKLTTFWQSFWQGVSDPDSSNTIPIWLNPAIFHDDPDLGAPDGFAELGQEKPLPVYIGDSTVTWVLHMGDIPALVAKYPGVAAALQRAGLSATQEEAARAAFLGARLMLERDSLVLSGSLAKNRALLCTHQAETKALDDVIGVWGLSYTVPCWRSQPGTP